MITHGVQRIRTQFVVAQQHVQEVELYASGDVDDFVLPFAVRARLEGGRRDRALLLKYTAEVVEASQLERGCAIQQIR